ncbi:hypothetical protein L484_003890 [Morus notabilis]|uniref:Uncharacterized protein n=1 Tax=Morus notabilis TaxID=981085 RepID=W9RQJ7_9ROSA|nr:hypothetical protein L484_003890 [Morus notabilis]
MLPEQRVLDFEAATPTRHLSHLAGDHHELPRPDGAQATNLLHLRPELCRMERGSKERQGPYCRYDLGKIFFCASGWFEKIPENGLMFMAL